MRRLLEALGQATLLNPVLLKELRIGLREKRIFFVQLGYLSVLLISVLMWVSSIVATTRPDQLPEQGRALFIFLIVMQGVLLCMVTPGLTCGSISGERERHSLDMLMASRLSAAEIVAGKLGFACYYIILLLFSALPLTSVAFFLGGVSPGEAGTSYLVLLMMALLGAEIGMFYSSRETRSNYATTQSYLSMFLFFMMFWWQYALLYAPLWVTVHGVSFHPGYGIVLFHCYMMVFLFLKAMHRIRPKAFNIKLMASCFLLVYALELLLLVALLTEKSASQTDLDTEMGGVLAFYNLTHWMLAGMFLNETGLESALEESRFQRSWFSRDLFWLFVFSLGLMAPALVDLALVGWRAEHEILWDTAALSILQMFCLCISVRGVQSLFPTRPRYAGIHFVAVASLMVLPSLGLFSNPPGILSGVYMSPVFSVLYLWGANPSGTAEPTDGTVTILGAAHAIPTVSAASYCLLAIFFTVVLFLRRRRR